MGRTVSAIVTRGGEYLGAIGPFPVSVAWWSQVEPVVTHLRQALGVPVLVLRLLHVRGGDGARDGHVTYHVEALERPAPGLLARAPASASIPAGAVHARLTDPHELRSPWARVEGVRELLGWASDVLTSGGRPMTGAAEQYKTWNLAALFRLPTARGPVWLKTTPAFAADEASAIGAFARVDPGLVPVLVSAEERRILMEHVPGQECWKAPAGTVADGVRRLVEAQAAIAAHAAGPPAGLRDRRTPVLTDQIRELLDGDAVGELTTGERTAAIDLAGRWPALDDCGLPDTIVHGDFHPGNWRSDGGPPVFFDFADAFFGNPVLDGLRLRDFLPEDKRAGAARAWVRSWSAQVPGCEPGPRPRRRRTARAPGLCRPLPGVPRRHRTR